MSLSTSSSIDCFVASGWRLSGGGCGDVCNPFGLDGSACLSPSSGMNDTFIRGRTSIAEEGESWALGGTITITMITVVTIWDVVGKR